MRRRRFCLFVVYHRAAARRAPGGPVMQKILLISFIVAPIAIPMLAARHPSPVRGLRRALLGWVLFNIGYLFFLLVLYPRMH